MGYITIDILMMQSQEEKMLIENYFANGFLQIIMKPICVSNGLA